MTSAVRDPGGVQGRDQGSDKDADPATPDPVPPELDLSKVPVHVACVMDGNGRWAKARGLPRTEGHGAGEAALLDVVDGALEIGIKWITLYAFSTENWRRPPDEVRYLMNFNQSLLMRRRDELNEKGVQIRFAGRRDWRVPRRVLKRMDESIELTKNNRRMVMTMAFNYGGRAEIIDAVRALVEEGTPANKIDEKAIRRHLYFPDMPDPDLVIRTSGETRIRTSFSGRSPTASWSSPRPSGRTCAAGTSIRRSSSISSGCAASGPSTRRGGAAGPATTVRTRRRPPDCENGGVRIFSRIAIAVGIALLAVFVLAVITEGHAGAGAAVVAFLAIAALRRGRQPPLRSPFAREEGRRSRPPGPGGPEPGRRCGGRGPPGRGRGRAPGRALLPARPRPPHRRRHQPHGRRERPHPVSLFRDKGVVLRTYRLGEADKIIVFLTERHGKVRAVAKGIRKTTSKFGGRLEPLTQVDLLLWQGRGDLDIVNQVEVVHAFRPITRGPRAHAARHRPPRGE